MKKPMLNAIQKARMSMAMASKKPKLNPGFDSLPKEVRMKILKSKKPKMAMMKKPKLGGMKKTMMAMKTKEPKMAMKKPAFTKRGDKIKTYNIGGFVSKHTGLKPGSYERAVIMNGVRNAAPSRRKKIMELLKSNPGTADMFKQTKKPKLSNKDIRKDIKVLKKKGKVQKKLAQAEKAVEKNKFQKAMRKYKAATRKGVKSNIITKVDRKKLIEDARENKPKMASKKKKSKIKKAM